MYFTCSHRGCSHPRFEVYHLVKKKQKKGVACVSTVSTGGDLSCDMPNQVVWKLVDLSFRSTISPSDSSIFSFWYASA